MARRKKHRTHKIEEDTFSRSIVVQNCSNISSSVNDLVTNTRALMEPYVLTKLKQKASNTMKDFVSMAGTLNCGHIWVYNLTDNHLNLRLSRLPQGPTLVFRVNQLATHADIIKDQPRPKSFSIGTITTPPVLIFNNFDGHRHLELAKELLQSAFPPINVQSTVVKKIKRVILFHYDQSKDVVHMRHYFIESIEQSDNSSFISELTNSNIDLSQYGDISDAMSSLSHLAKSKSGLKLTELGPRLDLDLYKIVENVVGVDEGEVVYNKYVDKTPEQKSRLRKIASDKKNLKEKRRREQEENVKNKRPAKKVKFE
eukprot:NODE_344_length_10554_cov_0.516308.p4 type:complete len:313 gc:universal NODE_344_length_10554_cov_0.516308:1501-563(-)